MTKLVNWEQVDNMLIAGCNGVQVAAAIGVSPDTLYLRCQNEKNTVFTLYAQQKRAHGDGLLHAAQFKKAYKDGNPTMLIWLGKQRLDQKEGDHELLEPPRQDQIDKDHLIMNLMNRNAELEARANKSETE